MKIHVLTFSLAFCCLAVALSGQTLIVEIPEHRLLEDADRKLVVAQLDEFPNLDGYDELVVTSGSLQFTFVELPDQLGYTQAYAATKSNDERTLYFTRLPLMAVATTVPIPIDPKVPALITYADAEQVVVSAGGIELRGASSLSHPKKTYDLEFWEDATGIENQDFQFAHLREDDDWILDGIYNEPLRIRSNLTHRLWVDLHTLHYKDEEPEARAGADVVYVELFVNGSYQGLYNLSEPIDRKQLKLKKFNGELRGELYKGATWGSGISTYSTIHDYDNNSRSWDGLEMEYPDADELTDWSRLYAYMDFVQNASEMDFATDIWQHFDYENSVDYFLFLNLLFAQDNTGKNIYLARYNADHPYFNVPWDLDGVLGTFHDGSNINTSESILSNGLYDRLLDLPPAAYRAPLSDRWFQYRQGIFHRDSLFERIATRIQFLNTEKLYEREALAWGDDQGFDPDDLTHLHNWLDHRLLFLDDYFAGLPTTTNIPSVSVAPVLFPNPARERVQVLNAVAFQGAAFALYDLAGRCVLRGELRGDFIELGSISTGCYVLRWTQGRVNRLLVLK